MKTLVIIPAFNERENIESLIEDIKSFDYDYLIINDNSTDDTEDIARNKKYNLLDLGANIGISGVTRVGFKYAKDNNYDCVISIDGDGQHQPKYVHELIREIEKGSDYVIGSRFVTKKKPWTLRMLGSRILAILINVKTGKKINDPTSGMRAVGKKVISEFATGMNYYAEPDTVCYLLRKGYKVKEIQVEMLERQGGTSYFVSPLKSIKFMIGNILSIIFVQ